MISTLFDLATDTAKLPAPAGELPLMTDIPRLRAGHVGGQFWSVWVSPTLKGLEAVQATLEQIDLVVRLAARYPNDLAMAYTAADIRRIHHAGKVASLIGIEGGHQINNSLAVLRQMYALGARYMTLTHSLNNDWADAATDAPAHHGLTPFGREVVREMNRLGMLVDLSHVSPAVMQQALAVSEAPVIFSHSSARALDDHPRNVPDDVLALVRANGGVVMVNFYPAYVSDAYRRWDADHAAEKIRYNSPPYAGLYIGQPERATAALEAWERAHPAPAVTLAQVADHIEHVRDVAGIDHVGLGSDFDGIEARSGRPRGRRQVSGAARGVDAPRLVGRGHRQARGRESAARVRGRGSGRLPPRHSPRVRRDDRRARSRAGGAVDQDGILVHSPLPARASTIPTARSKVSGGGNRLSTRNASRGKSKKYPGWTST